MNKRIFFSLNLPEKVKEEIYEKYGKKLEAEGLKKVRKENLHITLLFLGYFSEEKIKELKEKIKKIKAKKFNVLIKGIECFNSKVIFLELTKGTEKIKELHEKICRELEVKDTRFNSHLTIARNKKMKKIEFSELIEKFKEIEFEKEIEVKSFYLMESILSSKGPEYKKIFSIEL